MTAVHRLLLISCAAALLAASCGQKGPLTLPEGSASSGPAPTLTHG